MKWMAAGLEVAADRTKTWLALTGVGMTGRVVVRLEDPIVGSVVPVLLGLWEKHPLELIGIDPRSPSATLVEPLQAEGWPLKLADAHGMACAHGIFQDLMNGDRLAIKGHSALDEAVRKASQRKLAGAYAIDRYAGTDASPLNAAELAVWALGDPDTAEGLGPDDVYVGKF